MATRTASATLLTIAVRPMSSGSSTSLIANPTVSRGSSVRSARSAGTVAKIVACGLSTPSVPPDQTIGTRPTSSARRGPLARGPAGPDVRALPHLLRAARALGHEHLPERPVGDDPRVVVDAAVALGLADDRDDPVRVEHAVVHQGREAAGVGHVQDRDLADLDGLGHVVLLR